MCNICNKGFTCSKRLKVHSRTHSDERPFSCDTCEKKFAYKHVLKLHLTKHLSERLYTCKMCPTETFKSKKAQEKHIKMHISTKKRQFVMAAAATGSSCSSSTNSNASSSPTVNGRASSDGGSNVLIQSQPPRTIHPFLDRSCDAFSGDHSGMSSSSSSPSLQSEDNQVLQLKHSLATIEPRSASVIQFAPRIYF